MRCTVCDIQSRLPALNGVQIKTSGAKFGPWGFLNALYHWQSNNNLCDDTYYQKVWILSTAIKLLTSYFYYPPKRVHDLFSVFSFRLPAIGIGKFLNQIKKYGFYKIVSLEPNISYKLYLYSRVKNEEMCADIHQDFTFRGDNSLLLRNRDIAENFS